MIVAAVRVRGSVHRHVAPAPTNAHENSSSGPVDDDGGGGGGGGDIRSASSRPSGLNQNNCASPFTQQTTSRDRGKRAPPSRHDAGAPAPPPGVQPEEQEAAIVAPGQPLPAHSQTPDDDGTRATAKSEDAMLSPGVVRDAGSVGAGIAVAHGVSTGRNKRRASAPSSFAQMDTYGAASCGGSRSSSGSSQRRGKRPRRTVDDDAVVLDPPNDRAAEATKSGGVAGARVSIKNEH